MILFIQDIMKFYYLKIIIIYQQVNKIFIKEQK